MNEFDDPPRLVDTLSAPAGLRSALERAHAESLAPAEIESLAQAVERRIGTQLPSYPPVAKGFPGDLTQSSWRLSKRTRRPFAAKVVGGLVCIGVVGALGAALYRRHDVRPAAVANPVPTVTAAAPGSPTTATESTANAVVLPAQMPPPVGAPAEEHNARGLSRTQFSPPQAAPESNAPPPAAARQDEYMLLQAARGALQSDPARALSLTQEHRRTFARGMLIQEREAIAIEALGRLGRRAEAQTRMARFLSQYPNSPYRTRLEAALGPRDPAAAR
jgi:hypothetical protein